MDERTRGGRRTDEPEERGERPIAVDTARPIRLAIHNPNGEVVVRGVDRGDVLVRHVLHGPAGAPGLADADLTISADGNAIDVRVDLPAKGKRRRVEVDLDLDLGGLNPFKGGLERAQGEASRAMAEAGKVIAEVGRVFGGGWSDVHYDIEVEVPRAAAETRIDVRTASGDVSVAEIAGGLAASTASGDVRVRRIRGELTFQTASGDVAADDVDGRLAARTASGDVRVSAATLDGFDLQSASGDLTLEATLTGGEPSRAQTVSGDVRLGLAGPDGGEPDAIVTLKTVSGDATVAAPFRKTERRTWQAGAGRHRIAVQSVSGDLDVRRATTPTGGGDAATSRGAVAKATAQEAPPPTIYYPQPATPPAPPEPPTPPLPPEFRADAGETAAVAAPREVSGEEAAPAGTPSEDAAARTEPQVARPEDARRLAVLAAVERGEIDVEEALRRLDTGEPGTEP